MALTWMSMSSYIRRVIKAVLFIWRIFRCSSRLRSGSTGQDMGRGKVGAIEGGEQHESPENAVGDALGARTHIAQGGHADMSGGPAKKRRARRRRKTVLPSDKPPFVERLDPAGPFSAPDDLIIVVVLVPEQPAPTSPAKTVLEAVARAGAILFALSLLLEHTRPLLRAIKPLGLWP